MPEVQSSETQTAGSVWRGAKSGALFGLLLSLGLIVVGAVLVGVGGNPLGLRVPDDLVLVPVLIVADVLLFAGLGAWKAKRLGREIGPSNVRVLCVAFQTGLGERTDYAELQQALQAFPVWHRETDWLWFVATDLPFREVVIVLHRHLDPKDRMSVLTLAEGQRWTACVVPEAVADWQRA